MIIHSNEVEESMKMGEKAINVTIPNNFTITLKEVSAAIDELNYKNTSNTTLREHSFIVERQIQTALINEKTNGQPLFDLSVLGYTNVKTDTIQYLYTPRNEIVGDYMVDLLTTYFEYEDAGNHYQVLLPLYLIHTGGKISLLPIQGQNKIVQESLEKK